MANIRVTANKQILVDLVARKRSGLWRVTGPRVCTTDQNRSTALFDALLAELIQYQGFRRALRARLNINLDN